MISKSLQLIAANILNNSISLYATTVYYRLIY